MNFMSRCCGGHKWLPSFREVKCRQGGTRVPRPITPLTLPESVGSLRGEKFRDLFNPAFTNVLHLTKRGQQAEYTRRKWSGSYRYKKNRGLCSLRDPQLDSWSGGCSGCGVGQRGLKKKVACKKGQFISFCEGVPSSVTDYLPISHLTVMNPGEPGRAKRGRLQRAGKRSTVLIGYSRSQARSRSHQWTRMR